jgi:lipoprotein-releasing system ATP-binding protein
VLIARNISKYYGDLHVLKGVDLEIQKGEVISIVGASGAGKSTLLHILGTLDKPDMGMVKIKDQEPFKLKGSELSKFRNENIGFIFQFHNLLPEFTALENVSIPGYIGGRNKGEVEKKAHELLKILGLQGRENHKPSQLSGGEQQRTAVARALVNNPSIVFADEPSGNLDSKNAEELHKLFFELRDKFHQTFVIVTHNQDLAAMADRTLEMKDGKIVEG